MDSVHEAHLSRILDARRRRGVLGVYNGLPPPLRTYREDPPPPAPTSSVQTIANTSPTRSAATSTTRTATNATATSTAHIATKAMATSTMHTASAATQTFSAAASPPPAATATARASSSTQGSSSWRQSLPPSTGRAFVAATPFSPYGTQIGAVRFQSPSRVPSLLYSTPGSTSRRAPSLWDEPMGARSIDPLPPPRYAARDPSGAHPSPFRSSPAAPAAAAPVRDGWGGRPYEPMDVSSTWRRPTTHIFSNAPRPLTALSLEREEDEPRRSTRRTAWPVAPHSRHRSRHRSRGREHRGEQDDGAVAPLTMERLVERVSPRRRGASSHRSRRSHRYTPPVVYIGPPNDSEEAASADSAEMVPRRQRRTRSRSPRRSPPREEPRITALGLPDARSTMDLRTCIETLRAGDWFYKWSAKGDMVHRRWIWVDTKSYLLLWNNHETRSPHFCGDIRLDHICQVTSRDLASVDEDGFPKTYYVLLIETTKRVLQLATELKDKCDAWYEALNNVMGFIHRHDVAKGALMLD